MPGYEVRVKDPDATLDYIFDWAALTNTNTSEADEDYLEAAETITSHTITAEGGITVDSSVLQDGNTAVKVWLSGGSAGNEYDVACRVDTSLSRTDERTLTIRVENL